MKVFTKPVLVTVALLIAIQWSLAFLSPRGEFEFSTINYSLGFFLSAISLAMSVCLIKLVRTNPGYSLLETDSQIELGIWGYFWRSSFVNVAALITTALFMTIIKLPIAMPSVQLTITAFIASLIIQMILSWLIFSKDRSGQMKKLTSVLRGW